MKKKIKGKIVEKIIYAYVIVSMSACVAPCAIFSAIDADSAEKGAIKALNVLNKIFK